MGTSPQPRPVLTRAPTTGVSPGSGQGPSPAVDSCYGGHGRQTQQALREASAGHRLASRLCETIPPWVRRALPVSWVHLGQQRPRGAMAPPAFRDPLLSSEGDPCKGQGPWGWSSRVLTTPCPPTAARGMHTAWVPAGAGKGGVHSQHEEGGGSPGWGDLGLPRKGEGWTVSQLGCLDSKPATHFPRPVPSPAGRVKSRPPATASLGEVNEGQGQHKMPLS